MLTYEIVRITWGGRESARTRGEPRIRFAHRFVHMYLCAVP